MAEGGGHFRNTGCSPCTPVPVPGAAREQKRERSPGPGGRASALPVPRGWAAHLAAPVCMSPGGRTCPSRPRPIQSSPTRVTRGSWAACLGASHLHLGFPICGMDLTLTLRLPLAPSGWLPIADPELTLAHPVPESRGREGGRERLLACDFLFIH